MGQVRLPVPLVYESILRNVAGAGEDGQPVLGGPIFLKTNDNYSDKLKIRWYLL